MSVMSRVREYVEKWKTAMSEQSNGLNGNGRKGFSWANVSVVLALVMATYSIAAPATSTYQERKVADERRDQIIQQILEHQRWQDAQYDKLANKVDKQGDTLSSIDKQVSVIAQRTDWMASWIKAGGQR